MKEEERREKLLLNFLNFCNYIFGMWRKDGRKFYSVRKWICYAKWWLNSTALLVFYRRETSAWGREIIWMDDQHISRRKERQKKLVPEFIYISSLMPWLLCPGLLNELLRERRIYGLGYTFQATWNLHACEAKANQFSVSLNYLLCRVGVPVKINILQFLLLFP